MIIREAYKEIDRYNCSEIEQNTYDKEIKRIKDNEAADLYQSREKKRWDEEAQEMDRRMKERGQEMQAMEQKMREREQEEQRIEQRIQKIKQEMHDVQQRLEDAQRKYKMLDKKE